MGTSISFPSSPTSGQTYTYGSNTWTWNGSAWAMFGRVDNLGNPKVGRLAIDADTIYIDTASGNTLTFTDGISGTKTLADLLGSGGSSFWSTPTGGTVTRTSNTTFTVAGDSSGIFGKGLIIKWKEGGSDKLGMVSIPSTYSAPNTTVTIIGDTMSSIDTNTLKYCLVGVETFLNKFIVYGSININGVDVSSAYYAPEPMRVIGADIQVGAAGVTNNTTVDINKNGTSMFATKPTLSTSSSYSSTPFTADSGSTLSLGDRVSLDIDAVQTTPAVDLYVQLYMLPTRYLNL